MFVCTHIVQVVFLRSFLQTINLSFRVLEFITSTHAIPHADHANVWNLKQLASDV